MSRYRNLFKSIKPRLQSYIQPIINLFQQNDNKPYTTKILEKELEFNAGLETVLENPDTLLENKGKDLTFYDTLIQDDKIKSCIELKKRFALSSVGDVIPASDDELDIQVADFCKWQFGNTLIDFYDLLDNYLDAMIYGYKVGEIMWESSSTERVLNIPKEFIDKWWVGNIKLKHSIYYDFGYDTFGNLEKLYIGRHYGWDKIIEGKQLYDKFLMFIYPYAKDGNYYGDSDLKEVYTQWYAKFNIFRFRNQYLEKYGMPIPEVIYDAVKTNATELGDLKDLMKNFQDSMYLINPGRWDTDKKELVGKFTFTLHETRKAAATTQYERAIDQIDKQISRKLLIPDRLGFSEMSSGSYSLGEVHLDIFVRVIEDLQRKLENLVDKLIKKIVTYNYDVKEFPHWKFDKLSDKIKTEMLKELIEKGVVDKREKWIRKYVGIPEITEKEKEEIEKEKEEARKNMPTMPPQFQPNQPTNQQPNNQQPQQPPVKQKMKTNNHPTDFKKIERHYNEAEEEFLKEYNRIWFDNTKYLVKQVQNKKIIETQNLKLLDTLRIRKAELKKLFRNYYMRLYITGKIDAIEEIEDRWKKLKKEGFKQNDIIEMQFEEYADKVWIKSVLEKYKELGKITTYDGEGFKLVFNRAYINAGITEDEMLKTITNTTYEGIRNNKTVAEISKNMEAFLVAQDKHYALTVARTGASDFYNSGRMNLFSSDAVSPTIEAYQYIAILDDTTTEFCASHDNQIIQKSDPALSTINPPNHYNCRSLLSVVFIGESDDPDSFYHNYETNKDMKQWGTGVPVDDRTPAKGFGGAV